MSNYLETRNNVIRLAKTPYHPGDNNFGPYSSIYLASTSNVKDTLSLYHDYKSVLCLGATGAHAYEAILNGATKIDMFDVNILQRLYYELMQTAIIYLDYETFMKHFTLKKQSEIMPFSDLKDLVSNRLFYILAPALKEEVIEAFEPVYSFFESPELIASSLFRLEHPITASYLKKFVSFYNEEEYYKLQKLLRSGQIELNYINCSIDDVPSNFTGPYDLILLDNLFQYYKNMRMLNTPYAVNMFISKKLAPMLSKTGAIQVNYGFEVATDALKLNLNLPTNSIIKTNPIIAFAMKNEQKEGINYQLLRKWDTYTYDFIKPVEDDYETSENVILTYRPHK